MARGVGDVCVCCMWALRPAPLQAEGVARGVGDVCVLRVGVEASAPRGRNAGAGLFILWG